MPTTTCTVAIYPPGDSHNRILVPDLQLTEGGDLERAAKSYALDAITALVALPQSKWCMRVVQTGEVQDATPITETQRNEA